MVLWPKKKKKWNNGDVMNRFIIYKFRVKQMVRTSQLQDKNFVLLQEYTKGRTYIHSLDTNQTLKR